MGGPEGSREAAEGAYAIDPEGGPDAKKRQTTMGYGNYSFDAHAALIAGRANQAQSEIFQQTQCHALMNPKGLKVRESRDSKEHPDALGIVFALDVTGLHGDIPDLLAKQELPNLMKLLTACNVADPQVMFMAIGDATSDHAALQVGQFETTAELMDQWLTWSYLEGGGGGTGSESYELAFYVAAQHTDMDNWVKRKKKGYFFMTGDELPYPAVSRHQVDALLGEKLDEDIPIEEVDRRRRRDLQRLLPDPRRGPRATRPAPLAATSRRSRHLYGIAERHLLGRCGNRGADREPRSRTLTLSQGF